MQILIFVLCDCDEKLTHIYTTYHGFSSKHICRTGDQLS